MSAKEIKVYTVQFNSALRRYLVMGEKGLIAQCVYLTEANKICDALNADTAIQDLELRKQAVEIEELRKQRNGNAKDRLEAIDGEVFLESYLKELDAEIEAKKAEVK